ncbi:MAG: hypothetical protein FWD66_02480 [Paludibacter sp.]|nr:hypothetical protein [Paludibacter sp.]
MKTNAPRFITLIIALILAVLGLIGYFIGGTLGTFAFWLVLFGFVVLFAGSILKGL